LYIALIASLFSCTGDAYTAQGVQGRPPADPPATPQAGSTWSGPTFGAELPPTTWSGSIAVPLVARTTQLGTVTASIDGDQLLIDYDITAPGQMIESFVDVETDPRRIPQDRGNHRPIPSRFAFHTRHTPGVGTFRYTRTIFWNPGDQVFIAAGASVVGGARCTTGWGAGVPFETHAHGNRDDRDDRDNRDDRDDDDDDVDGCGSRTRGATYFSFTPVGVQTLGVGTGWVSTHVGGSLDDTGQPFQADLLMLQPTDGLSDAPIPTALQADFTADDDFASSEYLLDASIVREVDQSTQLGQLTPALLAIAEPLDAAAPGPLQPFGLFGKCSDKAVTKTKSIDLTHRFTLQTFKELPPGFSGSIGIEGNLQGGAQADLHLALKRFKLFGACIPYGVKFIDLHGFGSALVNFGATLDGLLAFDSAELDHPLLDKQLINPTLANLAFLLGPIPVVIKLSLPVSVGLDLKAAIDASVTYNSSQTSVGAFDYTCTFSGCKGTSSFTQNGAPSSQPITGGVSGHIEPKPWAELAIRAALYDERLAYVQLGLRPYLLGDLWGFIGNNCGDANADGVFEDVHALTFDLDWLLSVNFRGAFLQDPAHHPAKPHELLRTARSHILFKDLIGSNALEPMLVGPASVPVNTAQTFRGRMRTCWPYNDDVTYQLDWGDGTVDPAHGAASSLFALDHSFAAAATRTLALTALHDAHGRDLDHATTRSVEVTSVSTTPPGPVPTAGLHLWLRADAGVSTSSGTSIAQWADQSGNGRNASMPSLPRQPAIVASALNGLPVVHFGGAQSFVLDTHATPTQFTIFIVGRNTKVGDVSIILGPAGSSPNNQLRWENDTNALFVGTGNNLPAVSVDIGGTRVYHALATEYDGAVMTVLRDGRAVGSAGFVTSGPWELASVGAFFSSIFLEGDLAEIMIYDRALATAEREAVDSYLRLKYALP
jgi:hypothetical protein